MFTDREGRNVGQGVVAGGTAVLSGVAGTAILWYLYGDCATASDYAKAFGIGFAIGLEGATFKRYKSGSYTVHFRSGRTYHGKGGRDRANKSARNKSRKHNDPVASVDWKRSLNDRSGFKDEATRIQNDRGVSNPRNYNKINSPGKKYKVQDGF